MNHTYRAAILASCGLLAVNGQASAATTAGAAADSRVADSTAPIANGDDIVVTATRVNAETPITASVHTTQPQAIISRQIIEDSVPATADFSDVILLSPGASGTSNGGGPGLSESKTVLRGFQDGQYNITYDGVPFSDSNDPTHHSTAYFPDGTYERIIVDRGPGGATDLGQASYGGNIHLISREAGDDRYVEAQGVYGSYMTGLGRLTINSGTLEHLGGLKLVAVGEWKQSDTALTGSRAWFGNGFLKAELPLGSAARLSLLTSYNQDLYHQSDSNGSSCTGKLATFAGGNGPYAQTDGENCAATSQAGLYGKGYGLVDFGDAQFAGTLFPSARQDFNWTNKTTDFEIARLQWNISDTLSIDNKVYTYFYKNFTVSAEDTTTACTGGVATQVTCGGYKTTLAGTGPGGGGGLAVAGNIPGYTKVNQYRTSGDVLQVNLVTPIGIFRAGLWYEHSVSKRYRYDYDFTKGLASGALADGHFDFAGMALVYNYKESVKTLPGTTTPYTVQRDGTAVPNYIRYDERTGWNQVQGFGEFELRLLDDRLKITPGVKVQKFTRTINTPIAAQTSRVGINAQDSYTPTLPYLTANFLIRPDFSVYAQFAKGFLIPALSASLETVIPDGTGATRCIPGNATCNFEPTRTTNYQFGAVFAGDRLNVDMDVYFIKSSNSTAVDPSSGVATVNSNAATYSGFEGQVSYVIAPGLTAIANGSIMVARDAITHLALAQTPGSTAAFGAVYRSDRFKISYMHKFTGRQFADGAQSVLIRPYSNAILSGSVRLGPAWLGVTVYNLFDDRSTTKIGGPTGAQPLYFFQPGRSYQAQIKLRF